MIQQKMVAPDRSWMTVYDMRILHAELPKQEYRHTHRILNTHCFFMAILV